MGLFSKVGEALGFSTPDVKRQPQSAFEREILGEVTQLGRDVVPFRRLEGQHMRDVDNIADDRQRLFTSANADVAQKFNVPTTSSSQALGNALRRAKGLSRIEAAGDGAIRGQQLRDRIALLKTGTGRRARGISGLARAAGIDSNVTAASMRADEYADASRSNLYGSIAGGLGRLGTEFLPLGPEKPSWALDQPIELGNLGRGRSFTVG